jgi:hypothetical protein
MKIIHFFGGNHESKTALWGDNGTAVTRVVLLQGSGHNQWCVALYFELYNSYYVCVWNYPNYTIASFWLLVLRTAEIYEMFPLRYTSKVIRLTL